MKTLPRARKREENAQLYDVAHRMVSVSSEVWLCQIHVGRGTGALKKKGLDPVYYIVESKGEGEYVKTPKTLSCNLLNKVKLGGCAIYAST